MEKLSTGIRLLESRGCHLIIDDDLSELEIDSNLIAQVAEFSKELNNLLDKDRSPENTFRVVLDKTVEV